MNFLKRVKRVINQLKGKPLDKEDLLEYLKGAVDSDILCQDAFGIFVKVLKSQHKTVGEIMVPRVDMVTIREDATFSEALELFRKTGYSKIPVIKDRVDNVVGILHIKELVKNWDKLNGLPVKQIALKPSFIPAMRKVLDALQEFRTKRLSIGIIVDQYGSVVGMVTLEDLLEEIVGEIWEEFDKEEKLYQTHPDGSLTFMAKIELEEASKALGVPLEGEDVASLGGLIISSLDRVPKPGETVTINGVEFKILEASPQRIIKVKARPSHENQNNKNTTS